MDTQTRIPEITAPDYELIWDGPKSMILVNPEDPSGNTLIKVFRTGQGSEDYFFNELGCGEALQDVGIRTTLSAVRFNNRDGLLLPRIPGKTLQQEIAGNPLTMYRFLQYGVKLAETLERMHRAGWFHLNINSPNVIVTAQNEIVLIGLSAASKVPLSSAIDIRTGSASLASIAPEQTGRLNRQVDQLSDLYSLGILYYEMLCGKLPFTAESPVDCLYAILSEVPVPPSRHNPEVLGSVDALVMRLLEKDPDNRYRTAGHVAEDLSTCLRELREEGNITSVIPSPRAQRKDQFRIPQKLYGREAEIKTLFHSYERISEGDAEMLLISSRAGTGKTSLALELQRYADRKNGFFVSGKFEQYQRNIPYLALNQAMASLVNRFLLEKEETFSQWKTTIREAVANYGRALAQLIPRLELVIGEQPELPELPPSEAQNRLHYVYKEFVRAVASREHPLVIFLDDLHWADSTTVDFIRWLMTNRDLRYLLLILAYRPDEVGSTHPLHIVLRDLQSSGSSSQAIELHNLSAGDISAMLGDIFGQEALFREELAGLLWKKTLGNAFFIRQFLGSLHHEGLISYDPQRNRWSCDVQRIGQLDIVGDVIELLIPRMQQLGNGVKEILRIAACIGTHFELQQLSGILDKSPATVLSGLQTLMEEGFIEKRQYRYYFVHDRVQQAAYSMLNAGELQNIHYNLGLQLLRQAGSASGEMHLFETLHHLNKSGDLINTGSLRDELTRLNLEAAMKAKNANAFAPASEYLSLSRTLLPENCWELDYGLSLKIHRESAEIAFLLADYQAMERQIDTVLRHATAVPDKIPVYEIRIMALRAQSRLSESVALVEEVLSLLKLRFPARPNLLHVLAMLLKVEWLIRGKTPLDLMAQPRMSDRDALTIMRILSRHDSTVYIVNQALMPLVLMKQLELTLRYGRAPVSPSAYLAYGVIIQAGFGNIARGFRLARLAMEMVELPESRVFRSRVIYGSMALIHPFNVPLRETVKPALEAHVYGLEDGDFEHASFAAFIAVHHQMHSGKKLGPLCEQTESFLGVLEPLKQKIPLTLLRIYHQFILNLMGRSGDPFLLEGTAFSEKNSGDLQESGDFLSANLVLMTKAFLMFHFDRPREALAMMAGGYRYWDTIRSSYSGALYMFHRSLYAAACFAGAHQKDRRTYLKLIGKGIAHLGRLSRHCPENHLNKLQLVQAEKCRLLGKTARAKALYDKAIATARTNQFIQEEGLAYHLAGRFYASIGEVVPAEIYLQKAHEQYREWGAQALADRLAMQYPNIAGRSQGGGYNAPSPDVQTLMETATALSGEMELDKLLNKLMLLVLKSGGAQSGALLLMTDHQLRVEAWQPEGGEVRLPGGLPLAEAKYVSQSIVNYAARTGEAVVVNNAQTDELFHSDETLKGRKVKSVLCLPLFNQGQLSGMLYLENNLLTGAFKPERVELLKTLSGQIAVSLINARLYRNMEEMVRVRTDEINTERKKSEDLLMNILPERVAQELKKDGKARPKKYDEVTVLFTDFVGFTKVAERLDAEDLVAEIDYCFREFDRIIGRNGLEKIKTIGDAYMCAAGLPIPEEGSAVRAVQAALEITEFMEKMKAERLAEGKGCFEIRVGLHTGPVVAGVVGTKKFTYDIWGDTVNTASRMESAGEAGKVNVSGATYALVKDLFECAYRGKVEAKNKGEVEMYWVLGSTGHNG